MFHQSGSDSAALSAFRSKIARNILFAFACVNALNWFLPIQWDFHGTRDGTARNDFEVLP
jgi:hypothetical protein